MTSMRRWCWLGGAGLILLIGAIAAILVLRERNRSRAADFGVVEPGLVFRSGQIPAKDIDRVLKSHHIKEIVFLSNDRETNADVTAEATTAEKLGIQRHNYPLKGDGTGNIIQYARAITAIVRCVNEKKPVLVHCATGAQRTGATIYFYRTLIEHWPADKAQAELFAYGHDPKSNPLLLPYIHDHEAALLQLLKDRHVIADATQPQKI